jgi:hypothetical protein
MYEDVMGQYLPYKLIDSNQEWKQRWFYVNNHHPELPKPSGYLLKHRLWWNTKPTMQKGLQLLALLEKISALRVAGLRAEHVAFNFMKRRIQPLMARDHLGYEYTRVDGSSRLHEEEINDELIIERLGRIFTDMPPYTPCLVEYSASRPPNKVSSRGQSP